MKLGSPLDLVVCLSTVMASVMIKAHGRPVMALSDSTRQRHHCALKPNISKVLRRATVAIAALVHNDDEYDGYPQIIVFQIFSSSATSLKLPHPHPKTLFPI